MDGVTGEQELSGPGSSRRAAGDETEPPVPIFRANNISKSFSGKRVLHNLDLEIMPGEVHALVGQNGCGKSTFIKTLAGFHAPDEGGAAWIRGRQIDLPLRSGDRAEHGFAFVHQDLGLVETISVLENVRVGNFGRTRGFRIPWRDERRHVGRLLARLGVDVSPDAPISELSQIDRTNVAIVRAFDQLTGVERGLLVLDEPTAALPKDGIERFFATVKELAAAGCGVLFVSHRLEEVFELADRVSVLRDGHLVHTGPVKELDEDQLIEHILGFSLDRLYPASHKPTVDVLAKLDNVSGAGVVDVSLNVHRGEIVGLTGLLGSGSERLPYLIFGAEAASEGALTLDGQTVDLQRMTPRKAIELGCAFLPANRLEDGSLQSATVKENLTLPTLGAYFVRGALRRRPELSRVRKLLRDYDVRPQEPDHLLASLSGGNQQKVLLAKWFETQPVLLLVHEPTHGVDVGARAQIYERLREAAAGGMGILLATSDYEDLPYLCDRVLVFRNGRVVSELHGADLTQERIVEQCFRTG
ncbi:sugar ABC transporter ATP-binding protein [Kribbella sp. NPDC050124]|uniref:sugar ABC transporter ATP-binding protein n=1 Tax=Kribbella sp. NPDC050124 TaxID=3364114 RepID=UPI0037B223BB